MTIEPTCTLADLGEIRLLQEVLLPYVVGDAANHGDDCAHVALAGRNLLWSMDPCPTPVAKLLGLGGAEVYGWYTALINLSDIAACGGTPKGLLVSLEMPSDTKVSFVQAFQRGLMDALSLFDTPLLGGNVKSSPKFSATATVIGEEGSRSISRTIDSSHCDAFLVGYTGSFWAAVAGSHYGWMGVPKGDRSSLLSALLTPMPQVAAGIVLSRLPHQVACMDCSDGPANALFQLASVNSMKLTLPDLPDWKMSPEAVEVLNMHAVPIENACYHFGDWQLACLIPHEERKSFEAALAGFPLTWMGSAERGKAEVSTQAGLSLRRDSLNENFRAGYNSITSVEELILRYMITPIFERKLVE